MEDLLHILWIEDNHSLWDDYSGEAEDFGLLLHPYECWEDAEKALLENYNMWSGIILDAKCKYKKGDSDNATRFLVEVQSQLRSLMQNKKRHINWYILSAGGAEIGDLDNLISDERLRWDADWPKKYYSKISDREMLYRRIRYNATRSDELTLRKEIYRDVFDAIKECNLDTDVNVHLSDLLMPIHFGGIDPKDYNNRFQSARKIIEFILDSMIKEKIIPSALRTEQNGKISINLTWSSLFIAGEDVKKLDYRLTKPIVPLVIAGHFKSIIFNTGSALHSNYNSTTESLNIEQYLKEVGGTTYLLRSMAFQICDIIMWYHTFLKNSLGPEENQRRWIKK